MRVYVAGPISSDVMVGVQRGFAAGRQLFLDGLAPYIPHADALWFLPEGNWNAYLEYDLEFVSISDAIYRLTGESKGADLECEIAYKLGIPVFYENPTDCPYIHEPLDYDALLLYAEMANLNGKQVAVSTREAGTG
jgi:hypothetical protein